MLLVALVSVSNILVFYGRLLKFLKSSKIQHCINGGCKNRLLHVYIYKPKTRSRWGNNFIFGTGNLHWCLLVPVKLQVQEFIICLKIQDLSWGSVRPLAHQYSSALKFRVFRGVIYNKIQTKSSISMDVFP